jgi:hypothetical protein
VRAIAIQCWLTRRCNGLLVSVTGVAEIIAAVELCRYAAQAVGWDGRLKVIF